MKDEGRGTEDEGLVSAAERPAGRADAIRTWLPLGLLLLLAGTVFCTGITWGLPSSTVNKYLFGSEPVWTGERIQHLAGSWDTDGGRGADVDVDPLAGRDQPVPLNETDAQRAEIVRRYRLYTHQPDEMITMRALSGMRPGEGRFDPRLYQYGGLWIYPVGAMLKLASLVGCVRLTQDVAWYLDHPEEFGKFYVVARLYTVIWGLIGGAAVFWITRRLTGGSALPAFFAGVVYACMPVVINMAHEAKPHLPGAVLQLLAVLAALRYADNGGRRWRLATAALCGAAFGMVLSAWPVFVVLPVMVMLRPVSWRRGAAQVICGVLIGAGVYLLTNPYIVINLLTHREVLRSNFGNSLAMYEVGRWPEGIVNAAYLMGEGASLGAMVIGLAAAAFLSGLYMMVRRGLGPERKESRPTELSGPRAGRGLLLAAPAVLITVQFVALAAGKPGEYGRFALLPDIALGIAAVVGIWRILCYLYARVAALAVLLVLVGVPGAQYVAGFQQDTSRLTAAHNLERFWGDASLSVGVLAEPAPYVVPPLNLFKWRVILLPRQSRLAATDPPVDILVQALDHPDRGVAAPEGYLPLLPARRPGRHLISWADKSFILWVHRSLLPLDTQPAATLPARSF